MATPPGDGGTAPREGFYPDPSIPGYVRYWNGAAWVPGTSRPAPEGSGAAPQQPDPAAQGQPGRGPATPAVEETGPVFFDEDPPEDPRQEPASVWQADVSRQTGFGGERDHRVSWGAPDPRVPGPAQRAADTPRTPHTPHTPRAIAPPASGDGEGEPPSDGTVAIRAMRRGISPGRGAGIGAGRPEANRPQNADPDQNPDQAPGRNQPPAVDSTMAIRALRAARRAKGEEEAPPASAASPAPDRPQLPAQSQQPRRPQEASAPWARQVRELAQPPATPALPAASSGPAVSSGPAGPAAARGPAGAEPPVVPWKPPAADPFLQMAQAQAASRPAGLGKRFLARLIDTVVLGAIVGAVAVPLAAKAKTHVDEKIDAARQTGRTVTVWLLDGTTGGYLGALVGALLVVGILYEALPTGKWGRTLGKKLCGLRVCGIESHEAPGFGAALRRWLVYSVLGVLVVGVFNVLWCLFDRPWRQCWHDKAARTFVAR
ncbi:RDD family protein [Streptomyces sp. NBC_00370]|uniref:RDD family protein n=2 Tax=unclassified Streptomyces TaxID=2593676 RepID=UPI002E26A9A6